MVSKVLCLTGCPLALLCSWDPYQAAAPATQKIFEFSISMNNLITGQRTGGDRICDLKLRYLYDVKILREMAMFVVRLHLQPQP